MQDNGRGAGSEVSERKKKEGKKKNEKKKSAEKEGKKTVAHSRCVFFFLVFSGFGAVGRKNKLQLPKTTLLLFSRFKDRATHLVSFACQASLLLETVPLKN